MDQSKNLQLLQMLVNTRLSRWGLCAGLFLVILLLAACGSSGGSADDSSRVVQDYYQALVDGNVNQMKSLSCAAWEESAQVEYDAFAGVKTSLDNLQCKSTGRQGDFTQVSCTGKIIATYGNENQEFDLGNAVYKTIQEAGEWRMCGY
jgi:hypothetical protein